MTLRRPWIAFVALLVLGLGAGCSDADRTPIAAEADEPDFRQGQQLVKQGRAPEALTSFLKVIEKRGVRNSPESHFEAGLIYLRHIKDPIEAIHHFRKYRELKPNSQQANLVRSQIDAAIREFAARLTIAPAEDQSVRTGNSELIEQLRRQNRELQAELATRGGGAPSAYPIPRVPSLTGDSRPRQATPVVIDLTTPPAERPPIHPAPPTPSSREPGTKPAAAARRTYTVVAKDTLYNISVRQYGHGRNVELIVQANRQIVPNANAPLKAGMVLEIPAIEVAAR